MSSKLSILTVALVAFGFVTSAAQTGPDYRHYHQRMIQAEKLITQEKYAGALAGMESVFDAYPFVFVDDYKVAAQLAWWLKDEKKAFHFIRLGISGGWTLHEIKKNQFLKPLRKKREWKTVRSEYDSLRSNYTDRLNQPLRTEVRAMFSKDQKLAIGNLIRFGQRAKERHARKKFAPHSEQQLARLRALINQYGYPGEKLVGNGSWMLTILSHHNSITSEYVQQDTLYPSLKPRLLAAIHAGELSPDEYAIIEDWYVAVKSDRKEAAFGYLTTLTEKDLPISDQLRQAIGMRSVETRNQLVDIQTKTGMDFYLEGKPWVAGKIIVADER